MGKLAVGDTTTATAPKGLARKVLALIASKPLLVAQMLNSAAGAAAMVMAAAAMDAEQFVRFSLLILITVTLIGTIRAMLFQPALIEMRQNPNAHISFRAATVGAAVASSLFGAGAFALGVRDPIWLLGLSGINAFPVFAEWLRMRGMALDQRNAVLLGDAWRLAATLMGPAVLFFTSDPLTFVMFVNLTYLATIVHLRICLPSVHTHLSPLRFWRPAAAQITDFVFGQAVSTIPLLALGGLGPSMYIGGMRLAQTLLGPLNMVLAAAAVNLLADGATKDTHAEPAELIRRGRRLFLVLAVLSPALVVMLLLFLTTTGFSLRGVDNRALIIGVTLVGALFTTTGLAMVDTFVMRLLGHQVAPTLARIFLVIIAGAGYVWGYFAGGVDLSLIYGFAAGAIANPVLFFLPAALIYRRYTVEVSANARSAGMHLDPGVAGAGNAEKQSIAETEGK